MKRIDTPWRWVRVALVSCAAVGGLAAWLLNDTLDLGRGTMLVPAVLGLSVVVGVGLGEAVVRPRRPEGLRTASLAPRRVADYVPSALTGAVAGLAILHLGTLALTTATASADDMGRAGRQIAAVCGNIGSASGPYPAASTPPPRLGARTHRPGDCGSADCGRCNGRAATRPTTSATTRCASGPRRGCWRLRRSSCCQPCGHRFLRCNRTCRNALPSRLDGAGRLGVEQRPCLSPLCCSVVPRPDPCPRPVLDCRSGTPDSGRP